MNKKKENRLFLYVYGGVIKYKLLVFLLLGCLTLLSDVSNILQNETGVGCVSSLLKCVLLCQGEVVDCIVVG